MKQGFVCGIAASLFWAVCAGQTTNPPVRLAIVLENKTVTPGESFPVTVELRDAYNLKSQARKPYSILLELRAEGQKPVQTTVQIEPGKGEVKYRLVIPGEGVWMIKALHPELREDAVYVRARKAVRRSAVDGVGTSELRGFPGYVLRPASAVAYRPAAPAGPLELSLYFTDQGGKFAANGSDKCRITAFLSDIAPRDLRLFFHANGGNLQPNPLLIPQGSETAETQLTSDTPGSVAVEFVQASPSGQVTLKSGGKKEVVFNPAIKELVLRASPPSITLLDSAEIQFELLDLHGNPVMLPDTKQVHLRLAWGRGELEPNPAALQANVVQGKSAFFPRLTGKVGISATTFGATIREELPVEVKAPWGTMFILFLPAWLTRFLKKLNEKKPLRECAIDGLYHGLRAVLFLSLIQLGVIEWSPKIGAHYFATLLAVSIGIGTGYFELSKLKLPTQRQA
jgi:hypothetical protein